MSLGSLDGPASDKPRGRKLRAGMGTRVREAAEEEHLRRRAELIRWLLAPRLITWSADIEGGAVSVSVLWRRRGPRPRSKLRSSKRRSNRSTRGD